MESADIRIVLVAPSHPGNIGACARAMKNMGLAQLVLVNPRQFPHPEASARASGAGDVLSAARVVESLPAALAGCGFVAATTSRDRDQYFRVADVRAVAARVSAQAQRARADPHPGEYRLPIAQSRHGGAAGGLRAVPCPRGSAAGK